MAVVQNAHPQPQEGTRWPGDEGQLCKALWLCHGCSSLQGGWVLQAEGGGFSSPHTELSQNLHMGLNNTQPAEGKPEG